MASYDNTSTPPVPPKTNSHETSRIQTPISASVPPPPPPHPATSGEASMQYQDAGAAQQFRPINPPQNIEDPGDGWLPEVLRDKSIQDLAAILSSPALLNALNNSSSTTHPSLKGTHDALLDALSSNMELANALTEQESRLAHQRSTTQAQLLSTHTLERQWRQKQSDMDHAIAPFAPAALYQQLGQGVQEQAQVCQAMEESFLDGDGEPITERDVTDWVRKYREAKSLYYLRQERKERWDEGRVGGWR